MASAERILTITISDPKIAPDLEIMWLDE